MDSMWGYKNERWRDLGWAAARLDDVLAWLPARISAAILHFTPIKSGGGRWPGWAVISAQASQMTSPNAGWPMTVAAWLHGRSMGGPTRYHGEIVEKPRLGPDAALAWDNASLEELLQHVRMAGPAGCLALWGAAALTKMIV